MGCVYKKRDLFYLMQSWGLSSLRCVGLARSTEIQARVNVALEGAEVESFLWGHQSFLLRFLID